MAPNGHIAHERVTGYIDIGEKEGATLLVDGCSFHSSKVGSDFGNVFWMGGKLFDRHPCDA